MVPTLPWTGSGGQQRFADSPLPAKNVKSFLLVLTSKEIEHPHLPWSLLGVLGGPIQSTELMKGQKKGTPSNGTSCCSNRPGSPNLIPLVVSYLVKDSLDNRSTQLIRSHPFTQRCCSDTYLGCGVLSCQSDTLLMPELITASSGISVECSPVSLGPGSSQDLNLPVKLFSSPPTDI